jgi:polyprenyl-phospho-N-acetylgalactosaminyl synthase
MKVYIVIPAFNEASSIGSVIRSLRAHYASVVVVDDASDDETASRASEAGALVLHHLINRGQGAALKTGISFAVRCGAEAIVTFDADGQHSVDDVEHLLDPIRSGSVDVALGSRFLSGSSAINMPASRRFMLRFAILFTRFSSGLWLTDTHNGLRALSRRAAQAIQIRQDRMAHASEILDEIGRHRLRYVEVPVQINYTPYSMSKGQSSLAFGKILIKYILGRIMQ